MTGVFHTTVAEQYRRVSYRNYCIAAVDATDELMHTRQLPASDVERMRCIEMTFPSGNLMGWEHKCTKIENVNRKSRCNGDSGNSCFSFVQKNSQSSVVDNGVFFAARRSVLARHLIDDDVAVCHVCIVTKRLRRSSCDFHRIVAHAF